MKIVRFISLFFTSLIVLFGHLSRAADDNEFVQFLAEFLSERGVPPRAFQNVRRLTNGRPIQDVNFLRAVLGDYSSPRLLIAYTEASNRWIETQGPPAARQVPPGHQEGQFIGYPHANQPPFQQPWQTPFDASTDELMGRFNNLRINTTHGVDTSYPSGSSSARVMSGGRPFYPGESSTSRIMTDSSQFRPRGSPPARTTYSRSRVGRSRNQSQQHRSREQDEGSPSSVWIQTAASHLLLDEDSIRYLYRRLHLLHQLDASSISDETPIGSPIRHFVLTFGDLRNLRQFSEWWNRVRGTNTAPRRGRRTSSSRRP